MQFATSLRQYKIVNYDTVVEPEDIDNSSLEGKEETQANRLKFGAKNRELVNKINNNFLN